MRSNTEVYNSITPLVSRVGCVSSVSMFLVVDSLRGKTKQKNGVLYDVPSILCCPNVSVLMLASLQ